MMTWIDLPKRKTIELIIYGKIEDDDYHALRTHLESKIQEWGHINILENVQDFRGYNMKAFWENLQFAEAHLKDIQKCAVVTDRRWIRNASNWMDPLFDLDIRAFTPERLEEARAWCSDRN